LPKIRAALGRKLPGAPGIGLDTVHMCQTFKLLRIVSWFDNLCKFFAIFGALHGLVPSEFGYVA
jgi:hypothetical protein